MEEILQVLSDPQSLAMVQVSRAESDASVNPRLRPQPRHSRHRRRKVGTAVIEFRLRAYLCGLMASARLGELLTCSSLRPA